MDFMSSFACPHGSTCDLFADVCDTPVGSPSQIAQNTATQVASSLAMTSSQAVIPTVVVTSFLVVTSTVEPESTLPSVEPATTTIVSIVSIQGSNSATTSGVASVSVVTVSATQAVATTSKSEALSLSSFWPAHALVLAIVALVF